MASLGMCPCRPATRSKKTMASNLIGHFDDISGLGVMGSGGSITAAILLRLSQSAPSGIAPDGDLSSVGHRVEARCGDACEGGRSPPCRHLLRRMADLVSFSPPAYVQHWRMWGKRQIERAPAPSRRDVKSAIRFAPPAPCGRRALKQVRSVQPANCNRTVHCSADYTVVVMSKKAIVIAAGVLATLVLAVLIAWGISSLIH